MKLPIYEIEFDESLFESGIDAIALTETPAIDVLSLRFAAHKQEFQSYNDYPKAASDNARRALDIREETGIDCGTAVGWKRANQLAKGENISRETIARMSGFSRHRGNSDGNPKEDCGALMWLAWGGTEGIEWAARKLESIDNQEMTSDKFAFAVDEDKMIVAGPAIIPDKKIYRKAEDGSEYFVVFRKPVIEAMVDKFNREFRESKLNLEHNEDQPIPGYLKGNWIIEQPTKDKSLFYGFEDLPKGTWFIEVQITDREIWNSTIKQMEGTGFSIEGLMGLGKEQMAKIHNKTIKNNMKKQRYFVELMKTRSVFNSKLQKFEEILEAERKDVLILSELAKGAAVEMLSAEGEVVAAVNGKYKMEIDEVYYTITVVDGVITEFVEMEKEMEQPEIILVDPNMFAENEGATSTEAVELVDPANPEEKPVSQMTVEDLAVKFDELIARYAEIETKIEEIVAMLPETEQESQEMKAETRAEKFTRIIQEFS
jgi:hypothetical protein